MPSSTRSRQPPWPSSMTPSRPPERPPCPSPQSWSAMSSPSELATGVEERSFVDAVRSTLAHAMRADPTVIVLGEDIAGGAGQGPPLEGAMGGTFGATKGLLE